MKFNYQAKTKSGQVQTGVVEASDRKAAFNILKAHNLYPIVLEKSTVPFYAKQLTIFQRAGRKDIVVFSRQLAIMFKSGVPVVEAFNVIARQTKKQDFKEKLIKIAESIEGGMPLSKSLGLYPKLFSSFYINMVKSGEASGKLADIFVYLADYLEKESHFQSKIRGAMIYPAFVLFVFLIVVLLMITYVIPQLSRVLKESEAALPLITKVVLALSDFLRTHALLVFAAAVVVIIGIVLLVRSRQGKRFFGKYLLRTPLIGPFLKKYYLSRIALNLSTLISGGVPIAQALEMTGQVVGNEEYKKIILKTRDGVERGETISSVLNSYPDLIAPLFYQMVTVGEKTGNLDSSLKNAVVFYQRDVDQSLDTFIQLLEPVFIILLGTVVGGLMAAVLVPLYSIGGF
jgi:type IV pilus assembly protein PilC